MMKCKRYFAAALCVLTLLIPVSALAEGAGNVPDTQPAAEIQQDIQQETQQETQQDLDTTKTSVPTTTADTEPETETAATPTDNTETTPTVKSGLRVVLNWQELPLSVAPVIKDETMFVSVRAFCEAMGCTVSWIENDNAIYATRSDLSLYITIGSKSVWANKRNWFMEKPCTVINGSAMVPIRTMAKVFSSTVNWYPDNQTVYLQGGEALKTADEFYDKEDLLWLARIIYLEAGGQPLDGKVAVANVVLNRVESSQFPDTVYDVIFDKRNGVQFTPTQSNRIYCTPPEICFTAAKLALEGYEVVPDCLYFVSLRSNSSCWAYRHRALYGTIGGHVFYY